MTRTQPQVWAPQMQVLWQTCPPAPLLPRSLSLFPGPDLHGVGTSAMGHAEESRAEPKALLFWGNVVRIRPALEPQGV